MTENAESEAKVTNVNDSSEEQLEQIRLRAFELYEARGREDGHEVEDWLQAKEEVVGSKP